MVTQSGPDDQVAVPHAPSRIVVAGDGTVAAIYDSRRFIIVDLPSCTVRADVAIDPAAEHSDIAWVGAPARLIQLSRYSGYSKVHLIHPHGMRTIAEIRLETPMRLVAAVGAHALAVGPLGTAVLAAGESHLTPYQFPARSVPVVAGSAAGQFVVALSASIEEWDPQTRMPKRRLKLPGPTTISALGGSDRVIWMTTQQDPTRIDVFAMVNRGQPKRHQLPEPIAQVSGHPRSDLLVCRGAESGKLFVVDLDGKSALRTIDLTPHSLSGSAAPPGSAGAIDPTPHSLSGSASPLSIDTASAAALVIGRSVGVLVAQANRPVMLVALGSREVDTAEAPPPISSDAPQPTNGHAKRSTLYGDDDVAGEDGDETSTLPSQLVARPSDGDPASHSVVARRRFPEVASRQGFPRVGSHRIGTRGDGSAPLPDNSENIDASQFTRSLAESFSTWRQRVSVDGSQSVETASDGWIGHSVTWRDELVAWTRAVGEGGLVPRYPDVPAIAAMVERFALAPEFVPAIALLYGAHLCGQRGAAPVEVAHVLGRNWDEALGKGQLHVEGIARFEASRVCLVPCVQRALDGLEPQTGTLVGESGPVHVLGPCVVVSATDDVASVAATCVASAGGAILASNEPTVGPEFVVEARAYGAVPMARLAAVERIGVSNGRPLIIVVPDEARVEVLGLPRLA